MARAKFFNKGLVKGTVVKSDLIEFKRKDGSKDVFLSMEVNTGNSNKVKITMFSPKSNPAKAKDTHAEFSVNSKVEVAGNVREGEFETQSGKKGVDRSLAANIVKTLTADKLSATFILQGMVDKIREVEGGSEVSITIDTSYVNQAGTKIEQFENFTLFADEAAVDLMDELDVAKGCNAKFKGLILNKLEFDDYGDVVANVQMFKIDKVEEVIEKDDLTGEEEVSFL